MSANAKPVRLTASAEEANEAAPAPAPAPAPPAAPAAAPPAQSVPRASKKGTPQSTPRRAKNPAPAPIFPVQTPVTPAQIAANKTDSISAGIRRIVDAEKRTASAVRTPSDRSHTDRELPGDEDKDGTGAGNSAKPERGEQKPTAAEAAPAAPGEGGEVMTFSGRKRLEEVIKERNQSRKSRKSQQGRCASKRRHACSKPQCEDKECVAAIAADDLPPVDPKASQEGEESKETVRDSPEKREKKFHPPRKATKTVCHSSPGSSRACVNRDYLALYDRLVEEERKEFESQCRRKITIRFVIIFAATTTFFLVLVIILAVLLGEANSQKDKKN